jgi:hypothetical protein
MADTARKKVADNNRDSEHLHEYAAHQTNPVPSPPLIRSTNL